MFDGTLIQNRDISKVPSVRRNPILADVFTHLEYMEKRGSGLKKICDLSASLDGYKKELHPEFTSEANVFYTTIKNVNYPYKDEIGGVNRGSSDANRGSSANQNTSLVDIYGSKKRWRKDDLWATIQSFCATWHTPEDIALFIGKTPNI
jgi:predicted HTH transcriptional regulator